jgi:zinc and cadmium transporter
LFLLIPEKYHPSVVPHGVSFAIGALLSVAFLDLLPHALDATPHQSREVFWTILFGLLAFFLLEKVLLWRHFHVHDWGTRRNKDAHFHHPAGALIVLGESIHNFVDGVLIAAAFLSDIHLGFVTSLAIIAHEIPHEIGNFAVLLHSGYPRVKAFL